MTTDNWTANGIGNWATGSDWSLGSPPTSGEDAFIGTGMGGIVGSGADVTVNSLGISSAYTLDINSGSVFTTTNGTGSQEVIGSVAILDGSSLQIQNGVFENAGTVELESAGLPTNITIVGTVSLTGGGSVELQPGVSGSQNGLFGISASAELNNFNNDISGTGIIENVFFTNEANGVIETNNSLGAGVMQIWGNAPFGGDFVNAGTVRADNGGTLQLGEKPGNTSATIINDGLIEALGANKNTLIYIAGNVTINQSSSGRILLGGSNTGFDFIVSNGIVGDATLTINGGLLDGAGDIGDRTALVLNLGSGTIVDADTANILTLDTGSIPITNAGQIEAVGGVLDIESPVNSGNGTVSVGAGGTLFLDSGASINGNVSFTSSPATLSLHDGSSQISGDIAGAEAGDAIDLVTTKYAPSMQTVWQQNGATGTLSLVNNGSTLATLTLLGQYTSSDFVAVSADQGNSTQIDIGNPLPPDGTTADMILRDTTNGNYEVYDVGGNAILAAHPLGQVGTPWQVAGLGGFFGADTTDMLLRDGNTGAFEIYDISSNNITNAVSLGTVGLNWQVAGFGDFSSMPGETDMLMRNSNTGAFEVYDISNNQITNAVSMGSVGLNWQVGAFGNFSSLGESDMILRNTTTGGLEVYDISNNEITNAAFMGTVGLNWQIVGAGDFSSNPGETDLMMRNANTGVFEVYDISNNQVTTAFSLGAVGLNWQGAGFGPISGVAKSDMVLRDTNSGAFEAYDIANNQITTAARLGSVGLDWQVGGFAADPPTASMGSSVSTSQLVQAMAGFGGDRSTADTFSSAPLAAEISQQSLLTTPHA